jgi:hypothetical protein
MPPLIMHAVIILCALSIKHKYPANRCARIYLLVSMRQVVRENTRWNLLHPGVLWCTCLASMSQPARASPHVVETVPAERVHRGRRPTNSYFYANAPLQIQIDRKLSGVGPFGRQTTQNVLRERHVYQMHADRESSRRIAAAAAGGCNFLVPFMGGARRFQWNISHLFCVSYAAF